VQPAPRIATAPMKKSSKVQGEGISEARLSPGLA
jgi:hypothetical protein